jgi:formylglycine-generating enzyme required for sulfatase activity
VRHLATYIYLLSSTILEQQPPVEIGGPANDFNGPESLKSKDQIVDYLKQAVAYGHKALQSINEKNYMDQVGRPTGGPKMARIAAATFMMYHDMDHYGQMVEYLRMNGMVPPASQPRR